MAAKPRAIRKIVVAVDASASSFSALQNAVELASRLDVELIGIFVEDADLLRFSQLPIAHEVSAFSLTLRRLQSTDLELQLRAQAAQVRRTLARMCASRGVPCQFKVARGVVGAELLAAAEDADLMVLGKIGRSYAGPRHVGSITRLIVSTRLGMTLILQSGALFTFPVILLFDGSEQSRKALEVAGHLARVHNGRLVVMVLAENRESARRYEMEVMQRLQDYELGADFRLIVRSPRITIAHLIRAESTGPVVMPCDMQSDEEDQLCTLLGEISNPVLLVR